MAERRPPTEPFWQKASGRPKDLADVDLLTSNDPER
jgi:hypothetical protein